MTYFTDFFEVKPNVLDEYGAFNISLINDLPLFIDPFLLFGSSKAKYQELHKSILTYLTFLKNKSANGGISKGQIQSWFKFSEVKQTWLGFSLRGNAGSGLGNDFGNAMANNMHIVFDDLNKEKITASSHLEKAGLFQIGIGKDNISDFTCNLIKSFLLEYTEKFAKKHLKASQVKKIMVPKVYFDYKLQRWMQKEFILPFYNGDYVILTPRDILTKDDNWINSHDLRGDFQSVCNSIPNSQIRSEIFTYFRSQLPPPVLVGKGRKQREKKPSRKAIAFAVNETIQKFPQIIKYYIKLKEENKVGAKNVATENVTEVETVFRNHVIELVEALAATDFFKVSQEQSFEATMKRVNFLKDVIENKDGYRLFYYKNKPIKREADLQVIFKLTWFSSPFDVNREVNNGRGPVDYSVSIGSMDKTLVEFKLASNKKLKMNLENQVKIYERASDTNKSIKVILYFDHSEFLNLNLILKELKLENDPTIVLIDAGNNKPSASNVRSKK